MNTMTALPSEWNESQGGHFLWSNVNFGEAVSEVMTPLTWSLLRSWRNQWNIVSGVMPFGCIGGRLYLNASYMATALRTAGKRAEQIPTALRATLHMPLPENIEIPWVDYNLMERLQFIRGAIFDQFRWAAAVRRTPAFCADNFAWCQEVQQLIRTASSMAELGDIWRSRLDPRGRQAYLGVLSSAMRYSEAAGPLLIELTQLVGSEQADILFSSLEGENQPLASLLPLVGLEQVRSGQLSPAEYAQRHGHRGSNEWELFTPRPIEDPTWLDRAINQLSEAPTRIQTMLESQQGKAQQAWENLRGCVPRRLEKLRKQMKETAFRGRLREAIRSEHVRIIACMRQWALRAGQLSGQGEDVFFYSINELLQILEGGTQFPGLAGQRKAIYLSLKELPVYPALILGSFDPFTWAADPNRARDFFCVGNISRPAPTGDSSHEIRGAPGSAGLVEGCARVIPVIEEASALQPGEILVTALTDIGWTPHFPRAAAVVTDTGAALSHAAIVARELGIPAVVGCGDATRRIRTGDLLQVDGGKGIVRVQNQVSRRTK